MPIQVLMPALSPTMEKGNLAKWLKKEGETIKSGDVIAEIETDKATMEVEAVDEGTLAKILVPEGTQDVPVNDVIAVLAGEGEDVKAAGSAPERENASQPASTRTGTMVRSSLRSWASVAVIERTYVVVGSGWIEWASSSGTGSVPSPLVGEGGFSRSEKPGEGFSPRR